jgi:hypothetical protein
MKANSLTPSRAEILANHKPDHLYTHSTEKVKFYKLVTEDGPTATYQVGSRTAMQVVQKIQSGELESLELIKIVNNEERERIRLQNFTLERLHGFLELLSGLDLAGHDARRAIIVDEQLSDLDQATRDSIMEMLSGVKGSEIVQELMDSGALNDRDIINTGYRRQQLQVFEDLLYNGGLDTYKATEMGRLNTKDEIAWQYFFEKNPWIFGYSISYRFNTILQREFSASDTDASGRGQVNTDFLTADGRFAAFVELKRPDTPLFGTSLNRAGAWGLSRELLDVHSQALQQKAAGQHKLASTPNLTDGRGHLITQRAIDPKVMVVIGCWKEIDEDVHREKTIKEQTFELFRRDSRNIDYITYDELFERAKHIVEQGSTTTATAA